MYLTFIVPKRIESLSFFMITFLAGSKEELSLTTNMFPHHANYELLILDNHS